MGKINGLFFIFFNFILTKLQMPFYRFFKIQKFLRYSRSKSETTTGSLWDAHTKTAKISYFTKNLSPPTFFEINTLNF